MATPEIIFDLDSRITFSHEVLADPAPTFGFSPNVTWQQTVSGVEHSVKLGSARRTRQYTMVLTRTDYYGSTVAEEDDWDAFIEYLDDLSETFDFTDHLGDVFTARFDTPPIKQYISSTHLLIELDIIEVLQ